MNAQKAFRLPLGTTVLRVNVDRSRPAAAQIAEGPYREVHELLKDEAAFPIKGVEQERNREIFLIPPLFNEDRRGMRTWEMRQALAEHGLCFGGMAEACAIGVQFPMSYGRPYRVIALGAQCPDGGGAYSPMLFSAWENGEVCSRFTVHRHPPWVRWADDLCIRLIVYSLRGCVPRHDALRAGLIVYGPWDLQRFY